MVMRRNALGRGLDALIPAAPAPAPVPVREASDATRAPTELRTGEIAPNPDQPRRRFDESELERLAESIRRYGVLQPVVVRRAPAGASRPYELVVGERRWRASQRAGLETIPAVVQDVEPSELLEVALVENVQRRDLNPIELAQAFRALLEGGRTQDEVGERVGLDRSTVANHLRLLELPKELQEDVELGALSMGHAKALLQLQNPERRRHLRDRIVAEALSVRAAESLARALATAVGAGRPAESARAPASAARPDPNLRHLVGQLEAHLMTRVRIEGGAERGRIEVDYYGAEDLDRLSRLILEGRRT
jgi:ParB family transcriptional regulator, chromosome partitioning protein